MLPRPAVAGPLLTSIVLCASAAPAQTSSTCSPDDHTLCLRQGRIQASVVWVNQHDGGTTSKGHAIALTEESGAFWFFNRSNYEILLKVLDGSSINGHLWVGIGSLSDVEFTVTVIDLELDTTQTYYNPPGNRWGVLDTNALDSNTLGPGEVCGGLLPRGRCGTGLFCQSANGTCAQQVDGTGICTEIPQLCTQDFQPVCGCDGMTYGNDCLRQMAGVSRRHTGSCGTAGVRCQPELGLGCSGSNQYCQRPNGLCGEPGVCADRGNGVCPAIYDPVCGCDGMTYSNDCELRAAGVSKLMNGACQPQPQICGGIAGFPCPTGQTCRMPAGMCNVADLAGTCTPTPGACPAVYDPVCGCDGLTYGNDCELLLAGIGKSHDGECN